MSKEKTLEKLSNQIATTKYVLFFHNILLWIVAICVISLSLWVRFEPNLKQCVDDLDMNVFYVGVSILIFASVMSMLSTFLGCFNSMAESKNIILVFIGAQALCFILGLVGASVMLEYSTAHSEIQSYIRVGMHRLIRNAQHEQSREILYRIQESYACCGADGAHDYTALQQPLPTQCRNTVTGNSFFYGCVAELTWYMEEKTEWIATLAMIACLMHIINVAIATILMKALNKEEKAAGEMRNSS